MNKELNDMYDDKINEVYKNIDMLKNCINENENMIEHYKMQIKSFELDKEFNNALDQMTEGIYIHDNKGLLQIEKSIRIF